MIIDATTAATTTAIERFRLLFFITHSSEQNLLQSKKKLNFHAQCSMLLKNNGEKKTEGKRSSDA
jgi:hypothetical protein